MLSSADQDYIKAVYTLQAESDTVTTSALAAHLEVTAASVSGMLKKLGEAGLVDHNRYKGVRLTRKGQRAALKVIRRHRLVELFLVEILAVPWDHVHHEAEKLEHVISDDVENRIDKLLGYPEFDPHGAPIPSSDGSVAQSDGISLGNLASGEKATVVRVSDGNSDLLKYLMQVGLVPGATIVLQEILPFDGMVKIEIEGRRHNISREVAAAVWVKES